MRRAFEGGGSKSERVTKRNGREGLNRKGWGTRLDEDASREIDG